ncbi:MAG: zinc ribbon domain-containing protein [Neobacillus sp.]
MVSSVAVIVGFIMSIKNKNKVVDTSEFKACPYCAESIKKEAILCRYCGKDV